MFYANIKNNKYLIRLERGEEVNTAIKDFCSKNSIKNAVFSGIGSIENPTLAHYKVNNRKYSEKILMGIFELTNLTGNVGICENELLVHSHISISDDQMNSFGGHLVRSTVSATAEIFLTDLGTSFLKSYNKQIGLKLWDLRPEKN
ncbi:MAG: hypothetical protein A2857_04030 [Candidatus Levybacteria bacterium RIFCSPHIGHO2_01_FULL_36_15]|nr:MAG: hypothetical protein A2857_04030 [Candidatus Levybacteria bacterium RIFCSPHIGHO2_01_FULL_36_15]OGH37448.1 MAG: hypothetical protein A2905_04925 [Candidatus Levybacteria bacterium RIFCSPLOWO2_01_FULL_36_10]